MASNLVLEECLIDKSVNIFETIPEFAEAVALVNKFGELLSITPFTYYDLEWALLYEANDTNTVFPIDNNRHLHNQLIENLIAEILHFFGSKFDRSNMSKKLYWVIKYLNRWAYPPFDNRLLLLTKPSENNSEIIQGKQDCQSEYEDGEICAGNKQCILMDEILLQESEQHGDQDMCNKKRIQTSSSKSTDHPCTIDEQIEIDSDLSSMVKPQPNYLNLSSIDKLKLICFLVDAQLACAQDTGHLDTMISTDKQRILPLVTDSIGRKFWYFCDTWLFMEEDNEKLFHIQEEKHKWTDLKQSSTNKATKSNKRRRRKKLQTDGEQNNYNTSFSQRELDASNESLFTAHKLRVVCKCSEHFIALINAYKQHSFAHEENSIVIEKLEKCLQHVQEIENERVRKLKEEETLKKLSLIRQSNRIAKIIEQKQHEEQQRQAKRASLLAERKRIEEEHAAILHEHRRLTDSDIQVCTLSREERLKQRQQRIQEHFEREQLIEVGLLTPSETIKQISDEDTEIDDSGKLTKNHGNRGRKRKRINGEIRKEKKLTKGNFSINSKLKEKRYRAAAIKKLPAHDWWTPSPHFNRDGNNSIFISPFSQDGNATLKTRPHIFKRIHEPTIKRSLIAPTPIPHEQKGNSSINNKKTVNVGETSSLSFPFFNEQLHESDFCLPDNFEVVQAKKVKYTSSINSIFSSTMQQQGFCSIYNNNGFEQIRTALNLAPESRTEHTNSFQLSQKKRSDLNIGRFQQWSTENPMGMAYKPLSLANALQLKPDLFDAGI